MRRVIAIVLLIASIPLQFTWAAVHAYCEHDAGPYALHIGYHDHGDGHDFGHTHAHTKHADDVNSSGSGVDSDLSKGLHTDCGFCHAGCMAALSDSFSLPAFALAQRQQIYPSFSEHDAPFARPERPQWTYFA